MRTRWPARVALTGGSVFAAASAADLCLEIWYAGTHGGPDAMVAGAFLEMLGPICFDFMVAGLAVGGCGMVALVWKLWRARAGG
jgi:hypothetical protein